MPPVLPWDATTRPLMLAPMQGLTNRALRALMIRLGRPDVLFTEFIRVRPGARRLLGPVDLAEATSAQGFPLVVQLIGAAHDAMVEAARMLQDAGVCHLNINMGCPAGRMATQRSGGGWLVDPAPVPGLLARLRGAFTGSLSVKLRSGYREPRQVFSLVPIFEDLGLDYIVLHPRTVLQRYAGYADHDISAELVGATRLPVIVNGDVLDAATAKRVLAQTSAAGLMLGRGAIADPRLFERIRGAAPPCPRPSERAAELASFITDLATAYRELFVGEAVVLCKLKAVLCAVGDPALAAWRRRVVQARSVDGLITAMTYGTHSDLKCASCKH